jgi:UDP-N-acetylmuramyl pentapeptide synthase
LLELGDSSRQAHYEIGKLISELGIDYAGVVGEFKEDVVKGALEHGFKKDLIQMFAEKKDASCWINDLIHRAELGQDDVVLVKASRGMRFETIVAEIIEF